MGDAFRGILGDINECKYSPLTGIDIRKFPSFFHILESGIGGITMLKWRRSFTTALFTELGGFKIFYNLSKMDLIFSPIEIEDLKATVRTLLDVTSWMDWWTYAAKFLALRD